MALPAPVFPAAEFDGREQSTANDGGVDTTLAQGLDYNSLSTEVVAMQQALRAGVVKAFWNDTGAQLDAGDLVFISGWNVANLLPIVTKADAVISADFVPLMAQFVVIADVANGAAGNMAKEHTVTALDTSAFSTEGDPVYLSGTAGEFSPTAQNPANEDSLDRNVRQRVGVVLVVNAATGIIHFDVEEIDLLETARIEGWDDAAPSVAAGVAITLQSQIVDKFGIPILGRYQVFFSLSGGGLEWDDSAAGSITVTENTAVRAGTVGADIAEIYYTGSGGDISLDFDKAAAGTGWARISGPDGAVKTSFLTWT